MVVASAFTGSLVAIAAYSRANRLKLLKAVLSGLTAASLTKLIRSLSRAAFGLKREPFPLEEWVAQYDEDAVDMDIAVFDPHHHLWDVRVQDKGWPVPTAILKLLYLLKPRILNDLFATGSVANSFGSKLPVVVPYMGKEFLIDIQGSRGRGHKVVGTIYVECGWKTPGVNRCMEHVAEADTMTEVHQQFPELCCAIIPHADLRLGAAVEPALQYYKGNPLVKGIRHSLAWSSDPDIMLGPCDKDTAFESQFREGFALLSKYGFSYDSWLFHDQLPGLTDLARSFPDTTIICNHIGIPLGLGKHKLAESVPAWKGNLKELARQQNVYLKIGGFGMRFMGLGFDERPRPATSDELANAWKPYIEFCIQTFGVDRCMMESNFPMDKIACSYTVLFNALKKAVRSYSLEDRRKLFELNAKRVYRI